MNPAGVSVMRTREPRGPLERTVAAYVADCARFPQLDPHYHPTADGAVKVIWHTTPGQAEQIRAAFGRLIRGAR